MVAPVVFLSGFNVGFVAALMKVFEEFLYGIYRRCFQLKWR